MNSPHKTSTKLFHTDWPTVGGGGGPDIDLDEEQLFERMCA
eukprot:COSAG05_NODE_16764_length_339_cov_0.858333_1_plen_40_part_10